MNSTIEMKYLTRTDEPFSYSERLGISGMVKVMQENDHIANLKFEMVIEDSVSKNPGWGVIGYFHPHDLNGISGGSHMLVVFVDTNKKPFGNFEDAKAFCQETGLQLQQFSCCVHLNWIDELCEERGISHYQWNDESTSELTDKIKEFKAMEKSNTETKNGASNVSKFQPDDPGDVPKTRTLH